MKSFKKPALLLLAASSIHAHALTYSLGGGSETWPADKRNEVVAAMNEAVATYNANGYFDKHLTAYYNPGVPTAEGSYNGTISFGGSISSRVALHEIGHTLGVGTYWAWDTNASSGSWAGSFASARIRLYDSPNAGIGCGGGHFWPYGLNYDNEDGTINRIRNVRILAALRMDMGIVVDSDSDGIPDDWEMFNFGGLSQSATGDPDGDGISNLHEYGIDSNPNVAVPIVAGRTYLLRARHSNKVAAVELVATHDGANVSQATENDSASQKWTAYYVGTGYWKFINVNSGKTLEVGGTSMGVTGNVQQWVWAGTNHQQWCLRENGDGYWKLFNRGSSLLMDVYGGPPATGDLENIDQYTDANAFNQHWSFNEVSPLANNAIYSITALHSNQCARIPVGNNANAANVSQLTYSGLTGHKWQSVSLGSGLVRFINQQSLKSLEVAGSSTTNSGNIDVRDYTGTNWQKWRILGTDAGNSYKLICVGSNLCMDVASASTAQGANILQWQYTGSQNQKWRFDVR